MAYKIKSIRFTLEKARRHQVKELDERHGRYEVTSCNSNEVYQVSLRWVRCECPRDEWIDLQNGYVNHCSHIQAALIHRALKNGYHIVARAETANVDNLKRKVVTLKLQDQDHGDGVKWTARKISPERALAKIERIEASPRHLEDNFLRKIARQATKRLAGQEAEDLEPVTA